jgi:hypothetical protein
MAVTLSAHVDTTYISCLATNELDVLLHSGVLRLVSFPQFPANNRCFSFAPGTDLDSNHVKPLCGVAYKATVKAKTRAVQLTPLSKASYKLASGRTVSCQSMKGSGKLQGAHACPPAAHHQLSVSAAATLPPHICAQPVHWPTAEADGTPH